MKKFAKFVLGVLFGFLFIWTISAGGATIIEMFAHPQYKFWLPVSAVTTGLIAWALAKLSEELP